MKIRILAIACGIILPLMSLGTSFVDREVKEIFEVSTGVVEGMVTSVEAQCNKSGCSSLVEIYAKKTYKTWDKNESHYRFCSFTPVNIGFSYVFFIENVDEEKNLPLCKKIVKSDGVFSRFGNGAYRYMSPGSFNTVEMDGEKYVTGWILVKDFDAIVVEKP